MFVKHEINKALVKAQASRIILLKRHWLTIICKTDDVRTISTQIYVTNDPIHILISDPGLKI